MKKALIISCFYQNIQTSRPKLVHEFLKMHYEATLLTADFVHSTKSYDNSKIENVLKVHVTKYRKNFSLGRILSHILFALQVAKTIRHLKPGVLYICLPPNLAAWIGTIIAKKMGIKCIVDVVDIWPNYNQNSSKFTKFFMNVWGRIREKAIKNADSVILECELYRDHIQISETKKTVIPLAKKESSENFNVLIEEQVQEHNTINIAYLGAFSYSYDFDALLEILIKMKSWKPHLEIIGAGERKKEFLKKLNQANISFHDHGIVYDEFQKKKLLSKCQLGYNGFVDGAVVGQSYKSIDYLSFGIPLLNNLGGDTGNLIDKEYIGFNFLSTDIGQVVNKIEKTSLEDFSNMKIRAREVFEDLYSWDVYCRSMGRILKEVGEVVE